MNLFRIDKCNVFTIYILIYIADQLVGMLNSVLNVSETETVLASRGASALSASSACEATGCPSSRNHSHLQQSAMGVMQPISHYLTSHLSQLSQLLVIYHRRNSYYFLCYYCL